MAYITIAPYIPLVLWFPLALAATVALVVYGLTSRDRLSQSRHAGVLALMAVGGALPLIILLNPLWIERIPPPAGKPRLTVLVDRSASMATQDARQGSPRYAAALRYLSAASGQLEERFQVRIRSFAEASSPATAKDLAGRPPDGAVTDLAAAIKASLDDCPRGQAMLLLSDGIHNAGGGSARVRLSVDKARAMAAPIFTRTFGGKSAVRDIEVGLVAPQELAFIDQTLSVRVRLRQRGMLSDRLHLRLQLDGNDVQQADAPLASDGVTEAVFQIQRKKAGLYRYEICGDVLPGEVTGVNNNAVFMLRVVDEPVHVLLLEGKPYWDTKFLIRTLAADQSIDLTSVVKMAENRFLQRNISRTQPAADDAKSGAGKLAGSVKATVGTGDARAETWSTCTDAGKILADPNVLDGYQIVILGRDAEVFLDAHVLIQLKKWLVAGKGSLVCFRGPPASQLSQRLGELMPVRWKPGRESRSRVRLTDVGQRMQWLPRADQAGESLADLPSLATGATPERPRPLAVVVASSVEQQNETRPMMTYQPIGNGRVVVVEGAGMWRWAFLPDRYKKHDGVYGMLWRSLVRWLVSNAGLLPSQQVALRTDKVTFGTRETAVGTLLVRDFDSAGDVPQVELTGTGLKQPRVITPVPSGDSPGHFRVVFGRLGEGRYRARVTGLSGPDASGTTVFDVRGDLRERLEVAARPDLMAMIAEQSGGIPLKTADPGLVVQRFDQYLSRTLPRRVVRITAWDRLSVLLLIAAVWAGTWSLRRRSGLI